LLIPKFKQIFTAFLIAKTLPHTIGLAEACATKFKNFPLVPKLYLGTKMIAKFNLAVKKAHPSTAWKRGK
jgi:hypothetical protein